MSKVPITPEFINFESPPVIRALLNHLLEHADIVRVDDTGRPILRFEFACAPWLMDKLAAFDSDRDDLKAEHDEVS